jgi:hypothetical protein
VLVGVVVPRRRSRGVRQAGVYEWFNEGFDTDDLRAAKSLLGTLATE